MRRLHFFVVILIITLSSLFALAIVSWYFATVSPSYYGSSWMGQMWGSHMGTNSNYGMGGMMGNGSTALPSYLWIIPIVLGLGVASAVIGVAFYYAFPELKYIRGKTPCTPTQSTSSLHAQSPADSTIANQPASNIATSCDVLLKTMTQDEKKVLDILVSHNGKYLQKYIVKESGLSRLKTHRIIARFAERGIVIVKEFGNTNEITVSDWIKK